jgi:bacteriocin-like protein
MKKIILSKEKMNKVIGGTKTGGSYPNDINLKK